MNIIEQAARRLEELRRSGIEVPSPRASGESAARLAVAAPAKPAVEDGAAAEASGVSRPGVLRELASVPRPVAPVVPAKPAQKVRIDLARLAAMGYVTPDAPRAQIADEFRVIKRPLLTNIHGRNDDPLPRARLIMVTSSLPGEGKTFVTVNLAMSLAMELDMTVMLVDADVSRPSVLSRLGLPPSRGLLDVLTNPSIDVGDVLLRTSIDKLTILPAGAPNGRATEILASETMNRLLDEMASRYSDRIIVFDAPPLLPSTESRVLATQMGQVVMVVEADKTSNNVLSRALATIESCNVMPVLNKIPRSEVGKYYGYYSPTEE